MPVKRHRLFLFVTQMMLLAGQSAWATTNVALSVDPDIPEGTAGHWYVNLQLSTEIRLTLTADDLAAGKGIFKVYDDGGKNGNYSAHAVSGSILKIIVPTGYLIQVSGTVWTKSDSMECLFLHNASWTDAVSTWLVQSAEEGKATTFGPWVTYKDGNLTDGQYLTICFQSDIGSSYQGIDMTVTVIDNRLYNVTIADGITHGSVSASPTQAKYNDDVTLTVMSATNYHVGTVSYNDGSSDHGITPVNDVYQFKMPSHDVTVSATFLDNVTYYWGAGNDGSAEHPYIISDKGGWDLLVNRSKTDSYTDKHFELTADISGVTTMIATESGYPFCGIIEGKGHTVTLALTQNATVSNPDDNDSHDLGCAMILYAGKKGGGCTISNLTVSGTITTTCQWAAGFISYAAGTIALTDCRSSVIINSSRLGCSNDAGFVSFGREANSKSKFTFTRCLFDGAFISDVSILFSGLLGYGYIIADFLTSENCVVAPDASTYLQAGNGYHLYPYAYNNDKIVFSGNNFWNKNGTIDLIYDQGTQVYQVSLTDGVTAAHSGAGTVIGNGAATIYADGFSYGGNEYYTQGASVTLGNVPTDGMTCVGYTSSDVAIGEGGTFNMPSRVVTVGAQYLRADYVNHWQASLTRDGSSEANAYLITSTEGLDLLASEVNDGRFFDHKFFKLDTDINYSHGAAWDESTSTENNYKAIGTINQVTSVGMGGTVANEEYYCFDGTFDGQNHTISGIRIYNNSTPSQGLFAYIGDQGTVKNVTLADARISGNNSVGGIAGKNEGAVKNCHVAKNVTILPLKSFSSAHGGIVGLNNGTVSSCTSAANVTAVSGLSNLSLFGGIAGYNGGTINDCTAAGAIVEAVTDAGAIVGCNNSNSGSLTNNTYHSCLVGENAFNIGVGSHRSSEMDTGSGEHGDRTGATLDRTKLFLYDDCDNSALLAAYKTPSTHTANSGSAPAVSKLTVTLQGHTFYMNGIWNSLCLPFNVNNLSGTPLEGASVFELDASGTHLDSSTNALTLAFSPTTSIVAGKPYIVKWAGGSDAVNPVFSTVSVSNSTPPQASSSDDHVKFVGHYGPFEISDANQNAVLYVAGNKVGYSTTNRTLPSFGARFLAEGARTVSVDFGDGTGIFFLSGHLSNGLYWSTYYNADVRFTLQAGASAYTMGSDHKLYRLGEDGRVIPVGVAVVIISDVADIELSSSEDTSAVTDHATGGNQLQGSDSLVAVSGLSVTPHVLGVADDVFGFHPYTGDAIPANRAYYVVQPTQ